MVIIQYCSSLKFLHFYLSKVNIEAFNPWHECDSGHIPLYESDRASESSYLAWLIILTEPKMKHRVFVTLLLLLWLLTVYSGYKISCK